MSASLAESALLQMNSHVFENVSNFAPPSFWQGRVPCVPNAGYGAFTDLVVFKTGFYSVQFFALRLISAISDAFVIMPGPAEKLEVIGLMSGCFLQENVLSPKLQFLVLDSLDNLANVSQFTVSMSILESQEHLVSFTGPVYHNLKFASSTSFCGHIRFWTLVEPISNGCQLTQRDMVVELQFISQPICVVSPCGPGKP